MIYSHWLVQIAIKDTQNILDGLKEELDNTMILLDVFGKDTKLTSDVFKVIISDVKAYGKTPEVKKYIKKLEVSQITYTSPHSSFLVSMTAHNDLCMRVQSFSCRDNLISNKFTQGFIII